MHEAFLGATMSAVAVLALLGAQEAGKAAAWRRADIREMAALLGRDPPGLAEDTTLADLDAAWAPLAEALIAHGAAHGDAALLDFYRDSAARRELAWPV